MKFFDWLNDNPWLVFIGGLILIFFFSCSTPQTTIDLQSKATETEKAIDIGKDGCKTLECQDAMRQAKGYIKDSMDTVKSRDIQIKDLNQTIEDNQEEYDKELAKKDTTIAEKDEIIAALLKELIPWRFLKKWFYITLGVIGVGSLLYLLRGIIVTAIKTALRIT